MIKTEHIETPNHHMVDDSIISAFEQFRKAFRYTRINVQDGYMNYKIIRIEHARSIEQEAKAIISRLKLPLITTLKISRWDAVLTIEPA